MPRIGAYEVRSVAELNSRGGLTRWMDTGDEGHVIIAVIRHVVSIPVRGERLGTAHLLASPPQVRMHSLGISPESCRIDQGALPVLLHNLMLIGYRVELRPIDRPVSYLEFSMLAGRVKPDEE